MDPKLANQALELTTGLSQGAAKDRTLQAFFAGVAAGNPDAITASEVMAVAMSGQAVVERWAGKEPTPPPHGPSS